MEIIIKKIICFFCLFIFLVFIKSNVVFASEYNESMIEISVVCEDDIELENIEFNIYSAFLIYENNDSQTNYYNANFSENLKTNSEGKICFLRPGEFVSVDIEINSLPDGYGVNVPTHFFYQETNSYIFYLYKIDHIDFFVENGEVIAKLLSNNNDVIISNYSISKELNINKDDCLQMDNSEILTLSSIKETYKVYIDDTIYDYERIIELSNKSLLYKIDFLLDNKLIDGKKKADLYIDYLNNTNLYKTEFDEPVECGNILFSAIKKYYPDWKLNASASSPSYSSSNIIVNKEDNVRSFNDYIISGNDHFIIYYDSSIVSDSIATSVANEFESLYSYYHDSFGFLIPQSPYSSKYIVYIDYGLSYYGATEPDANFPDKSCIYIDYGAASVAAIRKRTVAHEYMHAILNKYGFTGEGINNINWIHESLASWSGLRYKGSSDSWFNTEISKFLNESWRPLNDLYLNRHYGSCIFFLNIYQEMGGTSTIKKILQNYSGNVFSAIQSGLSAANSSYSFVKAFSGFSAKNYAPFQFYAPFSDTNWGTSSIINEGSTYPCSSLSGVTLNPMTSRYLEFSAPSGVSNKTLIVTLNYSSFAGYPVNEIKTIRKASNGTNYISNATISGNKCIITQMNFGNNIAKKITAIPINACFSTGSFTYTWSAVLE